MTTPTYIGGTPLDVLERRVALLKSCDGVIARAAVMAGCTPSTIKRSAATLASLRTFDLWLHRDGDQDIRLGEFRSPGKFMEVAVRVARMFSGTLKSLELPGYVIRGALSGKELSLDDAFGRERLKH